MTTTQTPTAAELAALIPVITTGNRIVAPMPAPADHLPLSILNRGAGVRTVIVCSCEWQPAENDDRRLRSSTSCDPHISHRAAMGLPTLPNYADVVFGEGPWMGLTWDAWYAVHKNHDVDPYTGTCASARWANC